MRSGTCVPNSTSAPVLLICHTGPYIFEIWCGLATSDLQIWFENLLKTYFFRLLNKSLKKDFCLNITVIRGLILQLWWEHPIAKKKKTIILQKSPLIAQLKLADHLSYLFIAKDTLFNKAGQKLWYRVYSLAFLLTKNRMLWWKVQKNKKGHTRDV